MSKFSSLRDWMNEHDVTFSWAAAQMGVSPSLLSKLLRQDRIAPSRHAQLVELRFPAEYLPDPIEVHRGPKKGRVTLPDWIRET